MIKPAILKCDCGQTHRVERLCVSALSMMPIGEVIVVVNGAEPGPGGSGMFSRKVVYKFFKDL